MMINSGELKLVNMKRLKLAIEAKLNDCGGDLSKQWFVFYSVRNPLNGRLERKKVYKGLGGRTDKGRRLAADRLCAELNAKLHGGWNPLVDDPGVIYADQLQYQHIARKHLDVKSKNRTFNRCANEYLDRIILMKRSPATITTYKSKFRHFELYLMRCKTHENDIATLTSNDFEDFITYMQKDRNIGQNHTAEFTILFRAFGKWLVKKKVLITSPFEELRVPKVRGIASRTYNDFQISRLRNVIIEKEPQLWLVVKFIFYCFTRPKELRMLRISDIDFSASRLTISAEVAKNNKTRVVDIPLYFLNELMQLGWDKLPVDYYLITQNGIPGPRPAGKNYMGRRFKRYHRMLELSSTQKFYGIKHSGVVNMIRSEVDWLDLKNQLGHHSLDQVMTYGQELIGTSSEKIRNVRIEI